MAFDYSKLRGRIVEKFGSQSKFARKMEWSERTLCLKMTGKVAWKQTDILKAINLLGLTEDNIQEYFFNVEVQIF